MGRAGAARVAVGILIAGLAGRGSAWAQESGAEDLAKIAYTTKDAWTYTLNSESTDDWVTDRWSVPVNFLVTKLLKIGDQPISIGAGVRYWAESPTTGAHDFGARAVVTFLFPTQQK